MEVNHPKQWIPLLKGQRVDGILFCVDISYPYTDQEARDLYFHLHSLVGQAFQFSISVLVVFNKCDRPEGTFSVTKMISHLRLDVLPICSWYK
jgi:hypothetical protein